MADEFGGDIPVAPSPCIGTDADRQGRGRRAARTRAARPCWCENHGPFTIGADASAAVKAAVMCEDVCRTVHIARQLGEPMPIAPDDVDRLYERYQNDYGQR